jgi:phosphoglucosamine mutase
MDVLLTGPIPTPAVGMLTRSMRADLGVMISASHNPFDDNGIKLFGPDGFKLVRRGRASDRSADRFRASQAAGEGDRPRPAKRIDGVQDRYIEFAKRTLPRNLSLGGLRVVVDCANGAGYRVTPEALRRARCRGDHHGGRARRLQYQSRMRLDLSPRRFVRR